MELKILTPREQADYYDQFLEMLYGADKQFVPPLSARSSTTQQDLTGTESVEDGILQYFEQMKTQRFMAALEDGKVLGFVSYKEDYTCEAFDKTPNIYLSTLVVRPEGRGRGLTRAIYRRLFDAYARGYIFTRTWHTNDIHIRILGDFGFETLQVLENHRGPGIHTVYFLKKPTK